MRKSKGAKSLDGKEYLDRKVRGTAYRDKEECGSNI